MNRILVINLNRLGDVVQSSACVLALRRRHPAARITLLIRDDTAWAARHLEGVDEIVRWNMTELRDAVTDGQGRTWAERSRDLDRWLADPRLVRPDLAINVTHGALAAVLMTLFEPARAVGERMLPSGARHVGGLALRYMHELVRFRERNPFNIVDLYRMAVGAGWRDSPLTLTRGDGEAGRSWLGARQIHPQALLCGMQPGASQPEKSWPAEAFVAAAQRIVAGDPRANVIVFGAPGERQLVEQIARAGASPRIHAAITTLDELLDLLSRCCTLVTNDTSPMHLASACGVPSVLVSLGPTSFVETGPFLPGALAVAPQIDCFPCRPSQTCPSRLCHQLIDPEIVAELALAQLRGDSARSVVERAGGQRVSVYEYRRLASGNVVPVPVQRRPARARDVERAAYLALWSSALVDDGDEVNARTAMQEYVSSLGALAPTAAIELDASERGLVDLHEVLLRGERVACELAEVIERPHDGVRAAALAAELAEQFAKVESIGREAVGLEPLCRMIRSALDSAAPDEIGASLPRECSRIFHEGCCWTAVFRDALTAARERLA